MDTWSSILQTFLQQANSNDLKTSHYPKEWNGLKLRVSFGMGVPARIPWIAFIAPEMQVSKGFYPVYLYYKDHNVLVLAYGVSETEEFSKTWPAEIMSTAPTVEAYFDKSVARYGDSFVYKAYKISRNNGKFVCANPETNKIATDIDLESDLATILDYFKRIVSIEVVKTDSIVNQGLFYMEKQLEDFLIHNWKNTELGKKYDLIVEEGELKSQQYKTDIGPIDILALDPHTKNHIVIELKKNQSSDDTIGQLTRYMGWVMEKFNDKNVKGIIISADYDKKLEYALKVVQNIQVFLYKVDFHLTEFKA